MKKVSLVNLTIVIGLLVLCVMTLIAVYATAPESSVLLLEENFNSLDENKWNYEISDCEGDEEQFHYVTANEENRLIADGVLHIYPNITQVHFKTKREVGKKCHSCNNSENSTADCVLPAEKFSAKLQTKFNFDANHGRLEIRAKICCRDRIKFDIGMTSNQNSTIKGFTESANETTNVNSTEIRIFFGSASNQTIIRSLITDCEFHVYEVNWDEEKISLVIDNQKICEKKPKQDDSKAESNLNERAKFDSVPITKPFYLNIGVELEKEELKNVSNHSDSKRSLRTLEDESIIEVDYLRIIRTL